MLPHACGGRAGVPALAPLMRRHGPLLVAAAFALYTFQYTAISGLLPVYLVEQRGLSIGAAGSIAAFVVVANMLGNLSAGALLRLGVPLWAVVIAGFAGIGLAAFGIFSPSVPVAAVAVLTAAGLGLTGAIPASIFAAAPRLVREAALLALMFGLINQTSNLGQLLGPPALGSVVQQFGWGFAPVLIGIVALAGIATGVRLRHALRGAASQ
jgi:MFS family permease